MSTLDTEPFGPMGREIKGDVWHNDLDAKIIITSHNSRPGLGKTTLAIRMARDFDRNGWDAESKGFMSAHEYHNAYDSVDSGSVLLFDEIEGEADSRRSMSTKNVELSQAWAQNRFRNMISICTLPSVNMLDKRMMEMSDYWINVIDRGLAHPYKIYVNDFTGSVIRNRMGPEKDPAEIRFEDLPDDDRDYELLKEMKADRRSSIDKQYYAEDEVESKLKKNAKEVRREYRDEWIKALNNETELSTTEIAELPTIDVNRTRVVQIANDSGN